MTFQEKLGITRHEKFDLNTVQISGTVSRIWSQGSDVFVRLTSGLGESPDSPRFTLLIPGGAVHGQPLTLMKDDAICVRGYLVEAPYTETGRQFAERCRREGLLEEVPGLADVTALKMATCIVPLEIQPQLQVSPVNSARVEGIVSHLTRVDDQLYVRLAVYDEHTQIQPERTGKDGRPWRKAHYVSLHFVDGRVDGRLVTLKEKDRLRVTGVLHERRYSETLAAFLMRSRQIALLASAVNADDVRIVRVARVSTYIQAESMLHYTK